MSTLHWKAAMLSPAHDTYTKNSAEKILLSSWMQCMHTHMKTVCASETRIAMVHAAADADLQRHANQAVRLHSVHVRWKTRMSKKAFNLDRIRCQAEWRTKASNRKQYLESQAVHRQPFLAYRVGYEEAYTRVCSPLVTEFLA